MNGEIIFKSEQKWLQALYSLISKMHSNSSYIQTELYILGSKPINVLVTDSHRRRKLLGRAGRPAQFLAFMGHSYAWPAHF